MNKIVIGIQFARHDYADRSVSRLGAVITLNEKSPAELSILRGFVCLVLTFRHISFVLRRLRFFHRLQRRALLLLVSVRQVLERLLP